MTTIPKICGSSGLATGLGDTFEMDVQVQHKGGPALNFCAAHGETGWLVVLLSKCILTFRYYQKNLYSVMKVDTAKHGPI